MSYQEWLDNIELLKDNNNQEIKDRLLQEEINENIKTTLEPKLVELIKYKFKMAIRQIVNQKEFMFEDNDIMDLNLISFRKRLKFIDELTNIKYIEEEKKKELREFLSKETKRVYDILMDQALESDSIGLLALTIKNNIYKWGDENEL